MKSFYLDSHPCEATTFYKTKAKIILSSEFGHYAKKWGLGRDIQVKSSKEIEDKIKEYKEENLFLE